MHGFEKKDKALNQVASALKGSPVENDSIFLSDVIISATWGWTVHSLQRLIYDEINNTGRLVPPVTDTASIISARNSLASSGSLWSSSCRKSSGKFTVSSNGVDGLVNFALSILI